MGHGPDSEIDDTSQESHAKFLSLVEREARLRHINEHSGDMIYRFRFQPDPGFDYMSGAVQAITGWSAEDFYADPGLMFTMLHPDDRETASKLMSDPTDEVHRLRLRMQHRNGHWIWTEHLTVPVSDEDGVLVAAEAIARDITDQVRAETELVESERISRSVLESIPGPTAVLDATGVVFMINAIWEEFMIYRGAHPKVYGVGTDYLAASDEAARDGVEGAAEIAAGVRGVLAGALETFQLDYPAPTPGDDRWYMVRVSPLRTETGGAVVLHSEITERKRYEDQLRHQALHDPLTGLPNRALLSDRLAGALSRARRDGNQVGVLMLDLDGFKIINDQFGHAAGDELLVEICAHLAALVRPGDTVARLGGDEFVVLCEALGDPTEAAVVAERVVSGLSLALREVNGSPSSITVSIGVAVGDATADGDALLRDADAAMYHAKAEGKNRFEVFDTAMSVHLRTRRSIEEGLEHAIEDEELRLVYQPIFDLRSGACTGMEALLRWQHPVRGLLAPDEFLTVAEDTGLIMEFGDWVLRESCQQLLRWQQDHTDIDPFPISVNVSAQQMERAHFADEVAAAIHDAGISPAEVVLEISERTLMAKSVIPTAGSLRAIGVRLAIDDFGVGYSALSRLKTLPVDQLKLDRAFVEDLGHSTIDSAIVAAVIGLTRAMGIVTVAEGVETLQQHHELVALGCEQAQGFLYARPAPAEQIEALLRGWDVPVVVGEPR